MRLYSNQDSNWHYWIKFNNVTRNVRVNPPTGSDRVIETESQRSGAIKFCQLLSLPTVGSYFENFVKSIILVIPTGGVKDYNLGTNVLKGTLIGT